jgi:hypothetical protein
MGSPKIRGWHLEKVFLLDQSMVKGRGREREREEERERERERDRAGFIIKPVPKK